MPLALLLHYADDSSIFGALGISGQAFLIQLVTFLLAFLILRKWAFKPILKILEERRKRIEDGLKLGEAMESEKVKLDETVAAELHKARTHADKVISEAEAQAKKNIQESEDTAKKRADEIIQNAKEQIKQLSVQEKKRLEKEIIGLVSDVSEAVIQEKVDSEKDARLIDKVLKEQVNG